MTEKSDQSIQSVSTENRVFDPPAEFASKARVGSREAYDELLDCFKAAATDLGQAERMYRFKSDMTDDHQSPGRIQGSPRCDAAAPAQSAPKAASTAASETSWGSLRSSPFQAAGTVGEANR